MTDVYVLVEGETEKRFIEMVLAPYCSHMGVFLHPTLVHGQKNRLKGGGDVKFLRVKEDIARFLKQRDDTLVCTFVDYYGIKEWPNLEGARNQRDPAKIAALMNSGAVQEMCASFPDLHCIERRYKPYTAVHEFETLLLSNPQILAEQLGVEPEEVQLIVESAGGPEYVNNSPQTAPSKRMEEWSQHGLGTSYKKTLQGITIAEKIGINAMRASCPLFDAWLKQLGV